LIAFAFILGHYCARLCTAAMAIRRINLSIPSTAFPRGASFTPLVVPFLGPQNLVDLDPAVQFQLKQNITGAFAWVWYWRESTHGGIYALGSDGLIAPARASPPAISAIKEISRFGGLRRLT
jgi:hypothetical protein